MAFARLLKTFWVLWWVLRGFNKAFENFNVIGRGGFRVLLEALIGFCKASEDFLELW